MKNLNKKIGAVALAGMMALGGVVVSGVRAQAAPIDGSSLSLENLPNVADDSFIRDFCKKNGVKVLKADKSPDKIDKFVKEELVRGNSKAEKHLRERLLDVSPGGNFKHGQREEFKEYMNGLFEKREKVYYRIQFGIYGYIIQINKK